MFNVQPGEEGYNSINYILVAAFETRLLHLLLFLSTSSANWSITNLRPAPPLRPSIANASSSGGGSSSGSGGGVGINQLSSYSKKSQPTYEEDALVLRVIEAYCAAYQNTSRNTMHSGKRRIDFIQHFSHILFC